MIRIAITTEAFEPICATMPLGSVAYEQELNAMGQRFVWLEVAVADRLGALRRRGEGYSEVILRLTALEGRGAAQGGTGPG